ncbi:MAG: tetratricopeptide repeat protein [Paludibacter sp.]
MHFLTRLLIAAFCLCLPGCSTTPPTLKIAEEVMETAPDSALHILKQLHANEFHFDSDRALYGLLLFQALDKNSLALQPDSLINFAINYYLTKNDFPHLATSYFFRGRMYKSTQRYEKATIEYIHALDCLKDKKNDNLLGKIYSDMGDICFLQSEYIDSRSKYQLAADCFNKAGKSIDVGYKSLDIGRTYYAVKDYKTAQIYFRRALNQSTDSLLIGSSFQEIGVNYFWNKQYDSAQYYLRKSMQFPSIGFNFAVRCYTLSDSYYNTGQYDSAYFYAVKAAKHPSNFYTKRECYRILTNIEYLRKDVKKMGVYMSNYQSCTDSIRKIESQTKSTVLETMHKSTLDATNSKFENRLLAGLGLLVMVLSAFLYYIYRRRTKQEKVVIEKRYYEQAENIRIEEILKRQQVLLHKIENLKTEQAGERKKALPLEKELMDIKLYGQIISFDNRELFYKEMDFILNNLVIKLN